MDTKKWYQTALRYGQTNLTEIDPEVCDLKFWKDFWKKTHTDAIIVNAGGIVAYYPSRFKKHYRAAKLGERDFFGDFVEEGRKAGLKILARMDINRALESFYKEKPEWFARKKDGSPYIAQGRYKSCLNSGYYKEYIPEILKEIIEKYQPDGFTDNSWTGISRSDICYCENCKSGFAAYSESSLPEEVNYSDPVYRKWIKWNYQCRIDNWDLFNEITTKYGGEDCVWLGMVNANFVGTHASFCDLREVAKRSEIMMVDHQSRDGNGFEQNSLNGVLLHQLIGWDKIIPESMSSYVRGLQSYRRSASPELELQLWMLEGIAGGISPWWHIVGGAQEDTRLFEACVPVLQWHKKYESYLFNRKPVSNVGVLWSQDNVEFFGAEKAKERVEMSWRGINMALTRKGIPFLPINAEDIREQSVGLDLLILPELAVVTEKQYSEISAFAKSGGHILAIGNVAVMDEEGNIREKSLAENLFGIHFEQIQIDDKNADASWENPVMHNYLRIENKTHRIFNNFDRTAILPVGGTYKNITADKGTEILATYIPEFPIYPPEFSWTDVMKTQHPIITEKRNSSGGKALYFAWDIDSSYGRCALPDHGDLLGNAVEYLLEKHVSVQVKCDAYIDFKVYRQENRLIIHLINANHTGFENGYAEKNLPVGPVSILIDIPAFLPQKVMATEDGIEPELILKEKGFEINLNCLKVHQMVIVES